jgi:hypothetical protein
VYDTNSIKIIKGAIAVGVPEGYIIDKYLELCKLNPIKINEAIVEMLNKNVKEASLVIVSIPGTIPKMLELKIEACVPDVMASESSHSLSPASSSSKNSVPLFAKRILVQASNSSTSSIPENSSKSSIIGNPGI